MTIWVVTQEFRIEERSIKREDNELIDYLIRNEQSIIF
ncbi:Thymidylate synthase thyX (plasmid) [Borrelia hermsii MTW]|uniref:Thymidylate synthase thyX n=1 Tax=Borrelia hermsii MTW TaxID=1313291 RepID=W5T632_BORHE|nr:Thymidylate synthase thyX [Borrelia hermsii MTW]